MLNYYYSYWMNCLIIDYKRKNVKYEFINNLKYNK